MPNDFYMLTSDKILNECTQHFWVQDKITKQTDLTVKGKQY